MNIKQASILELMKEIKRKCLNTRHCYECDARNYCYKYMFLSNANPSPSGWDLEGLDEPRTKI